ncbi:hypothetical protein [Guptibacillus hwajinpoensis]|uniref:hypothetical protein n=1 Tax=Guptibacillus hwajinpoensis TaxID=208199 RepID=UPI003D03CC86
MDEIRMLVNALSKNEIAAVVWNFRIKVNGFHKNFERVPIEMLRSFLMKELKQGLKLKRKGRKYTTIPEVYEYISFSFLREYPSVEELSLEDLALKLETDLKFSKGAILSLIYTNFRDDYDEYKEIMASNVEENKPLLKGIVNKITIEEKLKTLQGELLSEDDLFNRLKEYISQVKEEAGKEFYEKVYHRVNISGEESFLNELSLTPKDLRHIPILAFLIEKNRYLEVDYNYFLQYVIRIFDDKERAVAFRTIKELEEEVDKKEKEFQKIKEEKERFEEIEKNNNRLKKQYSELKEYNDKLVTRAARLYELQEINEPFLRYFQSLLSKHRARIITSDTEIFHNTEIIDYVEGIQEFHCHRKKKNAQRYRDQTILISRASFVSTPEWIVTKRFFENNKIHYFELSGYDISDYIKQIVENLHKERMRVY